MAASTIDLAFIEQYNADAHNAYQRDGFKMHRMTRSGTVQAKTIYWQKVGALVAQDKGRGQMHNFQNMDHSNVSAAMVDKYVPTLIDDLDLLKLNIEERQLHSTNHMFALGNWADEQVRDAMIAGKSATTLGGGDAVALTVDHMLAVPEAFNLAKIPDDGGRYCMVTPKTWTKMLKINEFSNADYVGTDELVYKGLTAKRWAGMFWFMDTLPTVAGTNVASNLAWHRQCVGHGVNKEFDSKITYENLYSSWVAVSAVSSGAKVIDSTGVFEFAVDELA
jgi:hypothetical protein